MAPVLGLHGGGFWDIWRLQPGLSACWEQRLRPPADSPWLSFPTPRIASVSRSRDLHQDAESGPSVRYTTTPTPARCSHETRVLGSSFPVRPQCAVGSRYPCFPSQGSSIIGYHKASFPFQCIPRLFWPYSPASEACLRRRDNTQPAGVGPCLTSVLDDKMVSASSAACASLCAYAYAGCTARAASE